MDKKMLKLQAKKRHLVSLIRESLKKDCKIWSSLIVLYFAFAFVSSLEVLIKMYTNLKLSLFL